MGWVLILWGFTEKFNLGGHKKTDIQGEFLKKEGLGQFSDLRRKLDKKEGVVFLRAVDTPMHTMGLVFIKSSSRIYFN